MKRLAIRALLAFALAGCPKPPLAETDGCAAACVQRNPMRAVSPEQIEADGRPNIVTQRG